MRYYESLYIVNPNYEQDRLTEVMNAVGEKVNGYGFSIINHRVWGKKRLAYMIDKHKYGTYVIIHFETEALDKLSNFERFMELQKPVLRNQTVRLDNRPEVHVEEEPAEDVLESTEEKTVESPEAADTVDATKAAEPEPAVEETPGDEESPSEEHSEEESEKPEETQEESKE